MEEVKFIGNLVNSLRFGCLDKLQPIQNNTEYVVKEMAFSLSEVLKHRRPQGALTYPTLVWRSFNFTTRLWFQRFDQLKLVVFS